MDAVLNPGLSVVLVPMNIVWGGGYSVPHVASPDST